MNRVSFAFAIAAIIASAIYLINVTSDENNPTQLANTQLIPESGLEVEVEVEVESNFQSLREVDKNNTEGQALVFQDNHKREPQDNDQIIVDFEESKISNKDCSNNPFSGSDVACYNELPSTSGDTLKSEANSKKNKTSKEDKESLEHYVGVMVDIPEGNFTMGCDSCYENQTPAHNVIINEFQMSQMEITTKQFGLFIEDTGFYSANCRVHFYNQLGAPSDASWENPYFPQSDNQPVVCISYNDIMHYISWLNLKTGEAFRLPTEAEWEYAARAGEEGEYSYGNSLYDNANCRDCGGSWEYQRTTVVGSFKPNAFGLFDMHGNASEWVKDCYQENYENALPDGRAFEQLECPFRVVRGGSWFELMIASTASIRMKNLASYSSNGLGFRLALDKKDQSN